MMHLDDAAPGPGHNQPRALQWQTPHRRDADAAPGQEPLELDLDLVEAAFVEGFERTPDPTSFLRLAGVPFVTDWRGQQLELIRVEIESQTDVASITPHLGGSGHRVAPLPSGLVSKRRRLSLVYLGPTGQERLSLGDVRRLRDLTPPR